MGKPVLIHTMGKVGSSSIAKSLQAHGAYDTYQTHQLDLQSIERFEEFHRENGLKMPKHLEISRRVLDEVIPSSARVPIITLVREPIARNVSSFFQTLYMHDLKSQANARPPEAFIERFFAGYDHNVPIRWFDRHVKGAIGLDVYAHPFPFAEGRLRVQHERFDMLIIRCESTDEQKIAHIQDFLGIDDLELQTKNVSGSKKAYGEAYKATLEKIRFPESYIDSMYESQYAKHFYTDRERKLLREKWME